MLARPSSRCRWKLVPSVNLLLPSLDQASPSHLPSLARTHKARSERTLARRRERRERKARLAPFCAIDGGFEDGESVPELLAGLEAESMQTVPRDDEERGACENGAGAEGRVAGDGLVLAEEAALRTWQHCPALHTQQRGRARDFERPLAPAPHSASAAARVLHLLLMRLYRSSCAA
eukprot:1540164-Rhodomonas_salina.1